MTSILVVVGIVSIVPFVLVPTNGGGGGDPPVYYDSLPSAPILNDIQPDPDLDDVVSLDWSDSSRVYYYNVYRCKSGEAEQKIAIGRTVSSFIDGASKENGIYYYRIEAVNNIGKVFSNQESVVIDVPPPPPLEIPDSPVLYITVNSPSTDGEIVLEWDPVPDADDYGVYRSENDGSFDFLEEIGENYYNDLVLESGDYSYKIKAGNEAGISDFSNEVSIVVQLEGIPEAPFMNQLTYEIIGDTIKIYLDWEEVFCDSYIVYRSIGGAEYEPFEDGLTSTSYSEVLIEVGVYSYKVSAVNMFGESERSAYVSIEITEDGVPDEPPEPDDYTVITIIVAILVLGALAVPITILAKRRKR